MSSPRLVVVFGATGKQGGSVVSSLLAANEKSKTGKLYNIRAVTRNPSSDKGKTLAAQGVQVVAGDLDDYNTVLKAFEGANAAFGVTDFWATFSAKPDAALSGSVELSQGKNLANAAAATSTLDHYIWSTLPCVDGTVPHLQSKALVDEYIEKQLPELAKKTTFLMMGYYATNLRDFDPPKKVAEGKYVWKQPVNVQARIPMVGYTERNTGVFVVAILSKPDLAKGKYITGVTDTLSFEEIIAMWGRAVGVEAQVQPVSFDEYVKGVVFGEAFGREAGLNMVYFSVWNEGLKGWTKSTVKPVTKEELGIDAGSLVGVKATFEDMDWSGVKAK
ncbi:NAD(P)-binding protein [Hymenopellis radicata]|nr:NAD(P)-binding protein [Hymenopellis radicata]